MASSSDEIIDAALKLPESERLLIVTRLLHTLPDDCLGISDDDSNVLADLESRASDSGSTIPISELWKQD